MRRLGVMVMLALGVGATIAAAGRGGGAGVQACTFGEDLSKSKTVSGRTATVYCGPATAKVTTTEGTFTFKFGTCQKNVLVKAGDFQLKLGKHVSGSGVFARPLHLSLYDGAKGGVYKDTFFMHARFTTWSAAAGHVKITRKGNGGSFSGGAVMIKQGKVLESDTPVSGTFKCS